MAMTIGQIQQEVHARANHINSVEGGNKNTASIANLDVASIRNVHSNDWSYQLWDRKSPINGVSAETVLANRKDIPSVGEIYLVLNKDQVVIFQPHTPYEQGHNAMDSTTVHNHAQDHLDFILDEATINSMLEQI